MRVGATWHKLAAFWGFCEDSHGQSHGRRHCNPLPEDQVGRRRRWPVRDQWIESKILMKWTHTLNWLKMLLYVSGG